MNSDHNFCILSVKYEITETTDTAKGATKTTELEHYFVAREKEVLLRKIKKFENHLRNKKEAFSPTLFSKILNRFLGFLLSYKQNYNELLRL